MIGEVDDPRYFAHPDRAEAGILWLSKGYVEYLVPNILPAGQKIDELTFTMEISSEAPGFNNDWPSDITFLLNDTPVGVWTSPGDFGDRHGLFTPNWWFSGWNQYGLLKMLVIDQNGTYIDGMKISDVSTTQLQLDYKSQIRLKFAVQEDAAHVGGMTLFGSGFGNYSQGIRVRMRYSPMEKGMNEIFRRIEVRPQLICSPFCQLRPFLLFATPFLPALVFSYRHLPIYAESSLLQSPGGRICRPASLP